RRRREGGSATGESRRRALDEEVRAVAEKYASLDSEAARRERERQTEFARQLERAVADFERQARELYSKIEDRAQRLRVEREAERRAAELRREAQKQRTQARAASARGAGVEPGGVRVVRHAREDESRTDKSLTAPPSSTTDAPAEQREITVGDEVRLLTLGMTGVVERVRQGEAEVRVNNLRFREKLSNLELVGPAQIGRAHV